MWLPPNVYRGTGWVLREEGDERDMLPCWLFGPPSPDCGVMAVVKYCDGEYHIHAQGFTSDGNSPHVAGPYPDLITALVVMRMQLSSGSPLDIVDYFDPTPTPENAP